MAPHSRHRTSGHTAEPWGRHKPPDTPSTVTGVSPLLRGLVRHQSPFLLLCSCRKLISVLKIPVLRYTFFRITYDNQFNLIPPRASKFTVQGLHASVLHRSITAAVRVIRETPGLSGQWSVVTVLNSEVGAVHSAITSLKPDLLSACTHRPPLHRHTSRCIRVAKLCVVMEIYVPFEVHCAAISVEIHGRLDVDINTNSWGYMYRGICLISRGRGVLVCAPSCPSLVTPLSNITCGRI